jgi:hypothetical protein
LEVDQTTLQKPTIPLGTKITATTVKPPAAGFDDPIIAFEDPLVADKG